MGEMSRPRKQLTADETFCLCGWLATGDASTAYRLSHGSKSGDPLNIQKMASRWLNRPECQEYIETRRRADYKATKENSDDIVQNRTRADTVEELNTLISATKDPKIKGDLLLKLADLQRWKQAEQTDDDKAVTFYIPLPYDKCDELLFHLRRKHWSEDFPGKAYDDEEAKRHYGELVNGRG